MKKIAVLAVVGAMALSACESKDVLPESLAVADMSAQSASVQSMTVNELNVSKINQPQAEQPKAEPAKEKVKVVYRDRPAPPQQKFETRTRRECETKMVQVQVEVADSQPERSNTGMLLGAAAGALLGNQVGGGNGKTLATVAGAAAGAYAGNNMTDQPKPGTHLETRTVPTEVCHDVTEQIPVR